MAEISVVIACVVPSKEVTRHGRIVRKSWGSPVPKKELEKFHCQILFTMR